MWALIDNYDSFTHILQHYLLMTGHDCCVFRNDAVTVAELDALMPERLIISPGPGTPANAGITLPAIDHFHQRIPILGVCLGHQALGQYFGAKLYQLPYPMHGKTSEVRHIGHTMFHNIPTIFTAMRYHSLAINSIENTGLSAIASTDDGCLMALAHDTFPCIGLQFHPESVGTPFGQQLLNNWAAMY